MKIIEVQERKIEIKKLGAYSMIQCLDAAQRIISRVGLQRLAGMIGEMDSKKLTEEQAEKLAQTIQMLFVPANMDDLVFVLEKGTNLNRGDLEADGVDAIEIGSVIKVLRAFWDHNELARQFTEMGNELMLPVMPDAGGTKEPEMRQPAYSTVSHWPTDGQREISIPSALRKVQP